MMVGDGLFVLIFSVKSELNKLFYKRDPPFSPSAANFPFILLYSTIRYTNGSFITCLTQQYLLYTLQLLRPKQL